MSTAYTYIVRCADGSLYTGWTNDIPSRLAAHNRGRGARYTRSRLPVTLVYCEEHTDKRAAMSREWAIKQFDRQAKLELIDSPQNIAKEIVRLDKSNIILIGMPGSGKSTVGVLLAKALLMDFADTDLTIQGQCGAALCDIIAASGVERFKQIECEVLCSIECNNTVVATGGSAVYGHKAMQHFAENGRIVYLKVSTDELCRRIDNISTRGIAMESGITIEQLYCERAALYEQYADITVDCTDNTPEQSVAAVIKALKA